MTDQKPNCSTCPDHTIKPVEHSGGWGIEKRHFCGDRQMEYNEIGAHENKGCLSHPGARAWLMKDVIEELERRENNTCLDNSERYGYKVAIALIKNGVDKK